MLHNIGHQTRERLSKPKTRERERESCNVATGVNYGVVSLSSWSKFIYDPKKNGMRISPLPPPSFGRLLYTFSKVDTFSVGSGYFLFQLLACTQSKYKSGTLRIPLQIGGLSLLGLPFVLVTSLFKPR